MEEFLNSLAIDSDDSEAALFLGRSYSALYDLDNALKYMKIAIDVDPDYFEARASYGVFCQMRAILTKRFAS